MLDAVRWLEDHFTYPIKGSFASEVECIEHSLRKWKGVTPEVLCDYPDLYLDNHDLLCTDENGDVIVLPLDHTTCSLCEEYFDYHYVDWANAGTVYDIRCSACPIVKYTGDDCVVVYKSTVDGDPTLMCLLLEKVLEKAKENEVVQLISKTDNKQRL